MRPHLARSILLALLLSTASIAAAQKTNATASVITPVPQNGLTKVCDAQDGPAISSNAKCDQIAVKGGTATATGKSSLITQSAHASITMRQVGTDGFIAYADAESRVTNRIQVNGDVEAGDYIVLHFLTSANAQFAGMGTDLFNTSVLAARGEGDDDASFHTDIVYGNGNTASDDNDSDPTLGGYDLTLGFDNFTGLYKYTYGAGVQMAIASNARRTAGHVDFDVFLTGIDAYDVDNDFLGSVVFSQDGGEFLDLQTQETDATPEPASVVLLGTGLFGVLVAARKKRSAVSRNTSG